MTPPTDDLIEHAQALLGQFNLGVPESSAGSVAAAIRTRSGKIYSGICVDLPSGIGFCAEHAAAAEMLKSRETEVDAVVAVCASGVLSPCGRCRELLVLLNPRNFDATVHLAGGRTARLRELIPEHWLVGEIGNTK
jgi:cytidine deaminase